MKLIGKLHDFRAMATGIAVCGAGVGTVLFAPISGALIKAFSWRTVFAVYAGGPTYLHFFNL